MNVLVRRSNNHCWCVAIWFEWGESIYDEVLVLIYLVTSFVKIANMRLHESIVFHLLLRTST